MSAVLRPGFAPSPAVARANAVQRVEGLVANHVTRRRAEAVVAEELGVTRGAIIRWRDLLAAAGGDVEALSDANCRGRPLATPGDAKRWAKATKGQKERAAERARAVTRYRELVACGFSRSKAARSVADECGVSAGALRNWVKRADAAPEEDPLDAHLDREGRGRHSTIWDAYGADRAFARYCGDYLRLEAPGSAACWRRAEKHGRALGWEIPSEVSFRTRLRDEYSVFEIVLAREGREALDALYPHQERTVAGLSVMEWINGDGRRHDLFVAMPDGRIVRPVTWLWQEVKVRKIVGCRSGETESGDLVRMAFVDMVDRWGAPTAGAVIDNTHAASSKWFSTKSNRRWRSDGESVPGMIELLGLRVIHTRLIDAGTKGGKRKRKGAGQSKPVERAGLDLIETIDKDPRCRGAYTGPNPNAKPENYQSTAIAWETFVRVRDDAIAEYNSRPGRRMEIAAGRSIDEAWAEEIRSTPVRRLTAAQRALLLLAVEATKVRPDGSFSLAAGKSTGIPRNRYQAEAVAGGRHEGVVVRFDPGKLHGPVQCFELDGITWICEADILDAAGFADTEAAREHGRSRQQWKRGVMRGLAAKQRADALEDEHGVAPSSREPDPVPGVVEGVFGEGPAKSKRDKGRKSHLAEGIRLINDRETRP